MKKIVAAILVFAAVIAIACPAHAANPPQIFPQYVNTKSVRVYLSIDDNAVATATVIATANSGVTQIKAVTHIERLVNGRWYLAYIGGTETSWEDVSYSTNFNQIYTAQLSSTGTYRVVTEFTVTGTTVETITKTAQAVY